MRLRAKHFLFWGGVPLVLMVLPIESMAVEPYMALEAGFKTRGVIEEGEVLVDPKLSGDVDSSQGVFIVGVKVWDVLELSLHAGAENIKIEEFNSFQSSLGGTYGGSLRIYLYQSLGINTYAVFVQGMTSWSELDDRVRIEVRCTTLNGCSRLPDEFLARTAKESIRWWESTVLLGSGFGFNDFQIYGGLRYSWLRGEDRLRAQPDVDFSQPLIINLDLEEEDNLGVFLGLEWPMDRKGFWSTQVNLSLRDQDSMLVRLRRWF